MQEFQDELFSGAEARVFTTNADDPEEGRTFVWSKEGWFERLEGESGGVEFSPFASDDADLRQRLAQDEADALTEIDDEFAGDVRDEFEEQSPLYPEAPELSTQEW